MCPTWCSDQCTMMSLCWADGRVQGGGVVEGYQCGVVISVP